MKQHGSQRTFIHIAQRVISVSALTVLFVYGGPALAGQNVPASASQGNLASLRVQSTQRVASDIMRAVLRVQAEGENPARLADTVNETMTWALKTVAAYRDVSSASGSYSSYPLYRDNHIDRWRVIQTLRLESRNVKALSELIGQLQSRLTLTSTEFALSAVKRHQSEDGLIKQALHQFTARAMLVSQALGFPRYRIVRLNVSTSGTIPPPQPFHSLGAMRASSVAAPAFVPQPTRITVTVEGTIQMLSGAAHPR